MESRVATGCGQGRGTSQKKCEGVLCVELSLDSPSSQVPTRTTPARSRALRPAQRATSNESDRLSPEFEQTLSLARLGCASPSLRTEHSVVPTPAQPPESHTGYPSSPHQPGSASPQLNPASPVSSPPDHVSTLPASTRPCPTLKPRSSMATPSLRTSLPSLVCRSSRNANLHSFTSSQLHPN